MTPWKVVLLFLATVPSPGASRRQVVEKANLAANGTEEGDAADDAVADSDARPDGGGWDVILAAQAKKKAEDLAKAAPTPAPLNELQKKLAKRMVLETEVETKVDEKALREEARRKKEEKLERDRQIGMGSEVDPELANVFNRKRTVPNSPPSSSKPSSGMTDKLKAKLDDARKRLEAVNEEESADATGAKTEAGEKANPNFERTDELSKRLNAQRSWEADQLDENAMAEVEADKLAKAEANKAKAEKKAKKTGQNELTAKLARAKARANGEPVSEPRAIENSSPTVPGAIDNQLKKKLADARNRVQAKPGSLTEESGKNAAGLKDKSAHCITWCNSNPDDFKSCNFIRKDKCAKTCADGCPTVDADDVA